MQSALRQHAAAYEVAPPGDATPAGRLAVGLIASELAIWRGAIAWLEGAGGSAIQQTRRTRRADAFASSAGAGVAVSSRRSVKRGRSLGSLHSGGKRAV